MADQIRVRAYNVRFGDAILVTVPDRGPDGETIDRNILIDVGNVMAGEGGRDREVFTPVFHDIVTELDGRPVDLYVMTHEHLDHVQGLLWAETSMDPPVQIRATHSWLTGSAHPDYCTDNPDARKKRMALEDTYRTIDSYLGMLPADQVPDSTKALLKNNNPRRTADCVAHLRTIADTTSYVFRGIDLGGTHPFDEARFEIWGPEQNTAIYYGRFRPMALGAAPGVEAGPEATGDGPATPLPPPGVDAGAFYDLVERRRRGINDNLFQIDRASNNTSVVFLIEWRGWRLLFCGDAETRAWKEMNKQGVLAPVHFVKISHHGSHNGTPAGDLLDAILPPQPADDRPRSALVSTCADTYNNVPDGHTITEIDRRCSNVVSIGAIDDDLFTDLFFADPGEGLDAVDHTVLIQLEDHAANPADVSNLP